MSPQKSFLLLGLLLVGCQAQPTESIHPSTAVVSTSFPTPPFENEIILLADEFRSLRNISGQFSGGKWVNEVDQWQGRKHELMLALAERLAGGGYSRTQLAALLGPADHIVTEGDPLFDLIQSLPEHETFSPSQEFLVYEWRGVHDFLFFSTQDKQIIGLGWWYAGE